MSDMQQHAPYIIELCSRWKIRELSVFGSAARGEMHPYSDADVLVSFIPEAEWDLFDMLHLKDELELLFGRKVDIVEREALEEGDNWIVRNEILSTAERLYASA